ncbi:tRNA (adenosine(37)-N6)-threonylcarbamoyltransferase complex dimerization subunit type 1 TsaB [Ruminococcaceae bacterium OttesenSCG-928-A16]|nr:tRNA (adenosine(37)-N6)-threonylcarbamoyltransferase complex dimerization subunit type 1 TsaB [Ruminococcaceae bacterium OttesenSCG-928-A16]
MNILAIDASGKTAGVCVMQNGQVTFAETWAEGFTHSETLLPLVQKALNAASLTPVLLNCYAVTTGPGSFTGLRIGLALVKGLALVHNTPVAGVSTLLALAQGCGLQGTVIAALDARRGEVYWAAFNCQNGTATRLTPDTAGPVEKIAEHDVFLNSPVFFVGDGAKICYNVFGLCTQVQPAPGSASANIATGVARLAMGMAANGQLAPAAAVQPVYLRLSQAERERAERLHKPILFIQ